MRGKCRVKYVASTNETMARPIVSRLARSFQMKRNWCFTIFDENWRHECNLDGIKYMVYQRERCPDTGRLHYQGYLELERSQRLAKVKSMLGSETAHLEGRQGKREQARAYCMKEESRDQDPHECGDWNWSDQGKRTDMKVVCDDILEGKQTMRDIARKHPEQFVKYHKGYLQLHSYVRYDMAREFRHLEVSVLYGDAGSGKTRYAVSDSPDYYILNSPQNNAIWWDGYDGQQVLIIDDFYGWCRHHDLLRWLDGYPVMLSVKGGTVWAQWKKVYITSNKHPCDWYRDIEWTTDEALKRRINHIYKCQFSLLQTMFRCELCDHIIIRNQ